MLIHVPFWIIAVMLGIAAIIIAMVGIWIIVQSYELLADKITRALKIHGAIVRFLYADFDVKKMSGRMNDLATESKEQRRVTKDLARRLLVAALRDLSEEHFSAGWYDGIVEWTKERVDTIYVVATGAEWPNEIPQEKYNELRTLRMQAGGWPNEDGEWETNR